jgi:hypothetical protein
MTTFLIAFVVFLLALLGLSLGMILNQRPIKGSCGGLNQIDGVASDCGGACQVRGKDSDHPCPRRAAQALAAREADRRSPP